MAPNTTSEFRGRMVLVTGVEAGIGWAIATGLAAAATGVAGFDLDFLASGRASYIEGAVVPVAGGAELAMGRHCPEDP